jgi:hypothetical protein
LASAASDRITLDGEASMKVAGTVKSVDAAKRTVTIVDAQGGSASLEVGEDVRNLYKLQSGQRVFGTTNRQVHLTVLSAGEQAPRVAQVVSVDQTAGVVVLKDAQGETVNVKAGDTRKAATLKAGDRVAIDIPAAAGA